MSSVSWYFFMSPCTVVPVMNGHRRDQAKVSVHCRWLLIRGNLTLKCVVRGIDNVAVQGRYYCILSLHPFLGRPLFLLPETSSLSDFSQMWLCSCLKQWPNHFSLLFSRNVPTGLMWSNSCPSQHPHFS